MPELFVILVPLIMNWFPAVMVKALASGLKTSSFTSVWYIETVTSVWFATSNVAMSAGPSGTVFGVQFAAYSNRCWSDSDSRWHSQPKR